MVALFIAAPAQAELKAGAAIVDASWHVGASAGQYASTKTDCNPPGGLPQSQDDLDQGFNDCFGEFDPSVQQIKNQPSYGMQSRLNVRAIVFQNGGKPVAIAKTDLYIPQDLLWRRAAQILNSDTGGAIGESNLTMAITHDHSSPYYSSTAFGAWSFQDVFDIRFYDYYAHAIAKAVEDAYGNMKSATVGATVTYLDKNQQNVPGTQHADTGTPAGYPKAYSDHAVSVVRFDETNGKPIGQIVTYSLHGEGLAGNDLISADWVGPFQRRLDRLTGGTTVYMQDAVGNSETEENTNHDIHQRLWFEHKQFAQSEHNGGLLADAAYKAWKDIGSEKPDGDAEYATHLVKLSTNYGVSEMDRWFPGPISHPFPTVGNCRSQPAFTNAGNTSVPAAGLPDCETVQNGPHDAAHLAGFDQVPQDWFPDTPLDPGVRYEDLVRAGIPFPSNYGAPSHDALEEALGIHLQAVKIGPVLLTMCSCEQWNDQAQNIRSRTDRTPGNEWLGFNWANPQIVADPNHPLQHADAATQGDLSGCTQGSDTKWSCPDPWSIPEQVDNAQPTGRINGISNNDYQVMESQILNNAAGWDDPSCQQLGCGVQAESEPADPNQIFGGYTHDDISLGTRYKDATPAGTITDAMKAEADRGYTLTIPIAMANDYNGYIATYREYQRGDHYRKALTGYGPHSSDYLATRLVEMGHALNGDSGSQDKIDAEAPGTLGNQSPAKIDPNQCNSPSNCDLQKINPLLIPLVIKNFEDQHYNDLRAQTLGNSGDAAVAAYTASLPDDGGKPGTAIEQPQAPGITRFETAYFAWDGGNNYVDNPVVKVERLRADGNWGPYADQSGEIPVIVKYPNVSSGPVYASGGQEWKWTAGFEATVTRYPDVEAGADGEQATTPGTFHFVVTGKTQKGHAQVPYSVTSRSFDIGAWSALTAEHGTATDAGVSFPVGPFTDRAIPGGGTATIGPINYHDSSYDSKTKTHGFKYVNESWQALQDPLAGGVSNLEWYCLTCSFRPWLDYGHATKVTVSFTTPDASASTRSARAAAVERVAGQLVYDTTCNVPAPPPYGEPSVCQRIVVDRALRSGEIAYVCPGDLQDAYGNYNGLLYTAPAGHESDALTCPKVEDLINGPAVGSSAGGGSTSLSKAEQKAFNAVTQVVSASKLGLPSNRHCLTHRVIRFHVVAPVHKVKVRTATVQVNGKTVKRVKGDNKPVTLRNLKGSTVKVRLVVIGSDGRRYIGKRTYHLCKVKRNSKYHRKPAPKKPAPKKH